MFHVYGSPASRAFRIYWLLEDLQIPYTFDPISVKEAKQPEFLKINPNGKIPSLRDGDFYLFESAAIAYHICERSGKMALLPRTGTIERAQVDQWMFWVLAELEQPLWWNSKNQHIWKSDLQIAGFEKQTHHEFQLHKNVLKEHLKNRDYLVGAHCTIADIFCAHTLNWARSGKFLDTQADKILIDYIERLKARPSFDRAKKLLK